MANVPLENPGRVNVEGLIDLAADVIKLAVRDARRGPGRQLKTQARYDSALRFLQQLGLFDRVAERYELDMQAPYQRRLIED